MDLFETDLFAGPGFGEWEAMEGFEVVVREQVDQVIHSLPPKAGVMVRRGGLGFAVDRLDEQHSVGFQDARYFADHFFGVEHMVQRIGENDVHGFGWKLEVVEIAVEDEFVFLAGAEIDADRKAAQIVKGLDLGTLSRAEAEDAGAFFQTGKRLQTLF